MKHNLEQETHTKVTCNEKRSNNTQETKSEHRTDATREGTEGERRTQLRTQLLCVGDAPTPRRLPTAPQDQSGNTGRAANLTALGTPLSVSTSRGKSTEKLVR